MARVIIQPKEQIRRIGHLTNALVKLKELEHSLLKKRPTQTSWSVIEVVEHMTTAHNAYIEKIEKTLNSASTIPQPRSSVKTSAIPSFLIKRFPPKEGKIRFKMKTMKKFQPVLDLSSVDENKIKNTFLAFENALKMLLTWVEKYPNKDVLKPKFSSAVGSTVKFNIPEACEFILCHNERHFQQIKNIIDRL